ncbi:lecithin retinol acyltransferase family protein [Synechococcus sp. CS-1325]|uniref:lecithin retinol acyltransferase family protein n=1 Tax=unclassified Synechococcus TaxID=2626047 RepID=UPI000DB42B61|nr:MULTISPECIES: lecithin retinol acyltransferase family protein [unclassified Synechococcus]PZV01921.1 MAG: NC domain protein [Cyanobium sp.]MCT0199124.1 lecithin retinol acyltransferase family protein [Synechococcus sp. CS-1325]MCT0214697.1 lecithin retinol acyltransferase family protein [Synechococcus sp. CS-1326]MCT0231113.1 lecithin retinol acyltransferase family protein [Synechococcus sp. CS-1324]MCT0234031.1 lecithin retinol acyltransferase family protein [Synechococcus sp. CS-1327]
MATADHLQVPRQHGLFDHHGIDLGDGTVAHYLEGRQILRSPIDVFSRGETVAVVPYDSAAVSAPGVTLRRAMGRLGEQRYNLVFNNCEHFAIWCKTGHHRSTQVEDWLRNGSLGALAVGQFIPAALLVAIRLLLRQGLSLDHGRELAQRSLEQLDGLRLRLQQRLEQELEQAEQWWAGDKGTDQLGKLRLQAQSLADQLATVEELEDRLERLLSEAKPTRDDPTP